MAKKKNANETTYYTVYRQGDFGDISYVAYWDEWSGNFNLGEVPFQFEDKETAVALAEIKNRLSLAQDSAYRFFVREVTTSYKEEAVDLFIGDETSAYQKRVDEALRREEEEMLALEAKYASGELVEE